MNRLLGLALDHLADMVIVTDCELAAPGPRIVYVNAAVERLCGWRPGELIGCTPRVLQGPGTNRAMLDRIRGSLSRREPVQAELLNYAKDGRPYWVAMHITPVHDGEGRCTHFVGIERDITQVKLAQERQAELEVQLRQAQKMESLGTLAGGIVHDFNNILAAMLGQLDIALDDLPVDAPARGSLSHVRSGALRARTLVHQILTFCRKGVQQFERVALEPLLGETRSLLRATLPASVNLQAEVRAQGLMVHGDRGQLEQVLLNLATNAWHALDGRQGTITLGLDDRPPGRAPEGAPPATARQWAHLWVSDDGCGMDEVTQQRIFEPFFTTKRAGEGTGLGLSVVHGIVGTHGGVLEVHSVPGEGSTFHVHLPAELAAAEAPPPPLPAPAIGRGERVLYVDDDEVVLLMAEQLLARRGFHPVCTQDPDEALRWVQENPAAFDVLVTDFNMPGMSGAELARSVLRLRADLPVLLVSGFVTDEQHRQARAVRAWGPYDKQHCNEELTGWILRALQPPAATEGGN